MKRAFEIVSAVWTLACIGTVLYAMAHPGSAFWIMAFLFFLGPAMIVIGYQLLFWTEEQWIQNRRRQSKKGEFDEQRERADFKRWESYYRYRGGTAIVIGMALMMFFIAILVIR